ncbi:MAG: archease [Acidobacteriota bacterium]
MPRGYELFEHTADIGALVRAATLPRLFENASRALFDLMCDRRRVRPRRRLRVGVEGTGLEDLLVCWLNQLLYLHETGPWLFARAEVTRVDATRCRARGAVLGEPFDRSRHVLIREVKAVTYHQVRLVRGRSAWRVRLVFDV